MNSPFSMLSLLAFIFLLALLVIFVQFGALTIAFHKLGLSQESAFLLLFSSLFGSMVNLPMFRVKAERASIEDVLEHLRGLLSQAMRRFNGRTVIAVNVGGGLIPISFSIYLLLHNPLAVGEVLLAVALVSVVCYVFSRPMAGLGIGIPIFIPPVAAALVAIVINSEMSAPLAYVCGTLGVLIGADVLRLGNIRQMGVPVASIGGAGTIDGIFLTGIVAVLLA